ncbi:MAG: ABC transporter ATP-binding protein [Bacilli bacterium]|jgi:multiple sugar transport system ATP-binding protein|nr:ABC transporter ATP-binding protein [Bacilli bacterium]NLN80568.1 ABC transporter ATP-binding protein [Erysipelotrichia bacterium]
MEVRIKNLTKAFTSQKGPEVIAVNNMSFIIPDGVLVGLLGPSGCGKSTTLYMIAGLHKPTEGQIFFGDEEVTNVPPEHRGIGLVFQNYALYPHFTVRQNITFPLDNVRPKLDRQEKEAIAREMARIVDIEHLLDRKPKELSGGQQQRVAIARALSKRPKVLLLDEPLSNLDARLRLQTREEIKRIQRETQITTIFVTHDQEEAMSISDIIVVMKDGVIQQIGEPQHVYDEPENLFVAQFLGSPAINIFDGEIKKGVLYVEGKPVDTSDVYKLPHVYEEKIELPRVVDEKGKEVGEVQYEIKKVSKKDRHVKVGIRPESFRLNQKDGHIVIRIDYIEHIGRDISIVGGIDQQEDSRVKIIIPSELRPKVIDQTICRFDAARYYVFETDGTRIK